MIRKTVLILGAGSDLGRCLCVEYARSSEFDIWLAGRNIEQLESLRADLSIRYNVTVELFQFDASRVETHQQFFKNLPAVPDEVFWTIGYLGDQHVAEIQWEESFKIISSNYLGAVSILNIVASAMAERKSGLITGVSSVAGERGRQSNFIYGCAKAGLTTYLSGLRNSLFHSGVHVLTVLPGFMKTKMITGVETSPLLTISAENAASKIYRAIRKRKNVLFIFGIWRIIMLIIRNIPEFLFKRLKL